MGRNRSIRLYRGADRVCEEGPRCRGRRSLSFEMVSDALGDRGDGGLEDSLCQADPDRTGADVRQHFYGGERRRIVTVGEGEDRRRESRRDDDGGVGSTPVHLVVGTETDSTVIANREVICELPVKSATT